MADESCAELPLHLRRHEARFGQRHQRRLVDEYKTGVFANPAGSARSFCTALWKGQTKSEPSAREAAPCSSGDAQTSD
jgi:hypothetical protein